MRNTHGFTRAVVHLFVYSSRPPNTVSYKLISQNDYNSLLYLPSLDTFPFFPSHPHRLLRPRAPLCEIGDLISSHQAATTYLYYSTPD